MMDQGGTQAVSYASAGIANKGTQKPCKAERDHVAGWKMQDGSSICSVKGKKCLGKVLRLIVPKQCCK